MEQAYRSLTYSLTGFLVSGIALGLTTFIGLAFIESVGEWATDFTLTLTGALVMVAISSFLVSPVLSAITGLYMGSHSSSLDRSLALSTFGAFTGYFLLSVSSLGVLLVLTGSSFDMGLSDPSRVLLSFIRLENSAAFLSFPSIVIAPVAAYLGSDLKD